MNQFVIWLNTWFISSSGDTCYLSRPYSAELDDGRFQIVSAKYFFGQDHREVKSMDVMSAECSRCPGVRFVKYAMFGDAIVFPLGWAYSAMQSQSADIVEISVHLSAITPPHMRATIQMKQFLKGRVFSRLSPNERRIHEEYKQLVLCETFRAYDLLRSQGWDLPPRENPKLVVPIRDLKMFYKDEIGFSQVTSIVG